MADEKEVSPTGKALLSPEVWRILAVTAMVLGALHIALMGVYDSTQPAVKLVGAIVTALNTLGLVSPGYRKP